MTGSHVDPKFKGVQSLREKLIIKKKQYDIFMKRNGGRDEIIYI